MKGLPVNGRVTTILCQLISNAPTHASLNGAWRGCQGALCVGTFGGMIAIAIVRRRIMSESYVRLGFQVDESFRPFGDDSDIKSYAAVSECCDSIDPLVAQGMGYAVMRWLYLHAIYRLPSNVSTCLHVPAHVMSLACGLVVFLAVYGRTHVLDGDGLVIACGQWVDTVRAARAKATAMSCCDRSGQVLS